LRMRSGEFTGAVLRAIFGVLLPLVALDELWRFVYSQIPLKDGVDRDPAMLAANVLLAGLCSWLAKAGGPPRRVGPDAVAALAAVAVALCAAVGTAPAAYIVCLLLAAPANSWWAVWRRKLR
jgi:hypothetical protein